MAAFFVAVIDTAEHLLVRGRRSAGQPGAIKPPALARVGAFRLPHSLSGVVQALGRRYVWVNRNARLPASYVRWSVAALKFVGETYSRR
jgi:hypothetical protein